MSLEPLPNKGRIAIFVADLRGGGAERNMANLANGIIALGWKVDLVVVHKYGPYFDDLSPGIRVIELANRPPLKGRLGHFFDTVARTGKLKRYLAKERPFGMISALTTPNIVAIWARGMAKAKLPLLVTIRNTRSVEYETTKAGLASKILLWLERRNFPKADRIAGVSQGVTDDAITFLGLPPDRTLAIANPVITPALMRKVEEPLDHPWLKPGQPPVILGLGRLTQQKNFTMLINAFSQVKKQIDARLLILGEGEDRAALEAQIKGLGLEDSVSLHGFVRNPYNFLREARVFALSSDFEGLPTALIECLAAGTPAVSTNCPSGPDEILQNGKYGPIVPVGDADAFAAALIEELLKPKVSPPKEAWQPYERDFVAQKYIDVLVEAARAKAPAIARAPIDPKGKRIAMFITDLAGGGAERVMVNLATGMVNLGFEVDFLVAKKKGVYFDMLPDKVRLINLGTEATMLSLRKLTKYLHDQRPAALLSALNQPNTVAVWAKKLANVDSRVVISIHSTLLEEARGATNYRRRIMPFFARVFFPWADEIVAVSEDSAMANSEFLGIPRDRMKVILNPVITPALKHEVAEPLDHPWFAPGEPPVILGIGRLTRQKNFEMLIEAFATVLTKTPARLIILGEGEDRAALEAEVKSRSLQDVVSMPGFVTNPYQYLAHSRIFALSSRWEGLPTVLIESLGAGTPAVATDCSSGPREILADGRYGRLVPVGNPEAFAEALLAELACPKIAPPPEAYAPYDLNVVAQQYAELLLGPG